MRRFQKRQCCSIALSFLFWKPNKSLGLDESAGSCFGFHWRALVRKTNPNKQTEHRCGKSMLGHESSACVLSTRFVPFRNSKLTYLLSDSLQGAMLDQLIQFSACCSDSINIIGYQAKRPFQYGEVVRVSCAKFEKVSRHFEIFNKKKSRVGATCRSEGR